MALQIAATPFSIASTISHYRILRQLGGVTALCMEVTAE
jgi:hypothetical protein